MAHWIVQGNPAHWRIDDFFTDGRTRIAWPVRRYLDAVALGDPVALWMSGPDGGVMALGRVAGDIAEGAPDRRYWTGDHGTGRVLPLEFTDVFPDRPISRETLRADPRFVGSLILRMAGGGNPFPVTEREWPAIAERVPRPGEHAVVATTVRGAAALVAGGATAVREAVRSVMG